MSLKIVFLGDIVGRPGRKVLKERIHILKEKYGHDYLIANGENSAGGRGISPKIADELFSYGVDFITLGDHTFDEKKIIPYLNSSSKIIRPLNYSVQDCGSGYLLTDTPNGKMAIVNMIGRVFMKDLTDCPFKAMDSLLKNELKEIKYILLDFHAEATSEKYAMARYLDGKVSLIVGTHTHVPTADEQVLPSGTGYITDLGITGSYAHVIGMETESSLSRFCGISKSFKVGVGDEHISGIFAEIEESGRCSKIERVYL